MQVAEKREERWPSHLRPLAKEFGSCPDPSSALLGGRGCEPPSSTSRKVPEPLGAPLSPPVEPARKEDLRGQQLISATQGACLPAPLLDKSGGQQRPEPWTPSLPGSVPPTELERGTRCTGIDRRQEQGFERAPKGEARGLGQSRIRGVRGTPLLAALGSGPSGAGSSDAAGPARP